MPVHDAGGRALSWPGMDAEELSPELLIAAYSNGIFPMDVEGEIGWFSPDPRAIIELDELHVSRNLARRCRSGRFEIHINRNFGEVIRSCARRAEGTWISPEIIAAYTRLHELGLAHSVECWSGLRLQGGLYGVALGGAFFGESMFHRATDASKVALVALVERLRQQGFSLLDIQFMTPHLATMGAREIPRARYLKRLMQALELDCAFAGPEAV